jgi:hypothetical protein
LFPSIPPAWPTTPVAVTTTVSVLRGAVAKYNVLPIILNRVVETPFMVKVIKLFSSCKAFIDVNVNYFCTPSPVNCSVVTVSLLLDNCLKDMSKSEAVAIVLAK